MSTHSRVLTKRIYRQSIDFNFRRAKKFNFCCCLCQRRKEYVKNKTPSYVRDILKKKYIKKALKLEKKMS